MVHLHFLLAANSQYRQNTPSVIGIYSSGRYLGSSIITNNLFINSISYRSFGSASKTSNYEKAPASVGSTSTYKTTTSRSSDKYTTTRNPFSYYSMERDFETETNFQRSTLSYILPLKPLPTIKPDEFVSKEGHDEISNSLSKTIADRSEAPSLVAIDKSDISSVGFFETGSKELISSTISHW